MDVVGRATHVMLRLGANRPQGTAVVDVFTPTVAANEVDVRATPWSR